MMTPKQLSTRYACMFEGENIGISVARGRMPMFAKLNAVSRTWPESELGKADPAKTVVVTHHFPHRNSTTPKYATDGMTAAFGSQLPEDLMLHAGSWILGHTHSSATFLTGDAKRYVRSCAIRAVFSWVAGWRHREYKVRRGAVDYAIARWKLGGKL